MGVRIASERGVYFAMRVWTQGNLGGKSVTVETLWRQEELSRMSSISSRSGYHNADCSGSSTVRSSKVGNH